MNDDRRKIALFDLDGTLAAYHDVMVADLNKIRSPDEKEVVAGDMDDAPEWLENRIHPIRNVPGWWKSLPTLEDGFLVLDWSVRFGFQPKVLTKGPRRTTIAWTEKCVWCMENIDTLDYMKEPIDVVITHDKSGEYGTVLVEDWIPYILGWLKWRPRGQVILLDRPYNRMYEGKKFEHPQVTRFNSDDPESIKAMLNVLKTAYER